MKYIGKYEIQRVLGRGAMGKIYKVSIPDIGRIAALKRLDPGRRLAQSIGTSRLREMFFFEASVIAEIRHPNIADIWGFDETNGIPHYLMDYFCNNLGTVIGETYWADSPSRKIRLDRAVAYTIEILEGVYRLHYSGIIHRDLKPFNILLTEEDSVKISDFGLSKLRGEQRGGLKGLFVGTKGYAAPEQEKNPEDVTVQSDLYSVGVILYRMLSGRLPDNFLPSLSRYNPELDSDWDDFIIKALAYDPRNRFENAREMSDGLNQLYENFKNNKEKQCQLPGSSVPREPAQPTTNTDRAVTLSLIHI